MKPSVKRPAAQDGMTANGRTDEDPDADNADGDAGGNDDDKEDLLARAAAPLKK